MTTPAFTSSPLYTLDSINALLTRLPSTSSTGKEGEETRIQLLSAKISLLQSSTPSTSIHARSIRSANDSTDVRSGGQKQGREGADTEQQVNLVETRLELVDCYLRQGNLVLGESEALQVIATCKKIIKLPPPSKPLPGTTPPVPESRTTISTPPSSSSINSDGPALALTSETTSHTTPHHLVVRWSKAYDRALSALLEIDVQRGITSRAERWRGMRDRLRSTTSS